ncbi:MAG: M15 family metallopeptidase [Gemmatimonadetes bacterium]|nr:M15 family metallopeptidase [Gemmatimonadota bacterium]
MKTRPPYPRTEPIRDLNRIRIVENHDPLVELINKRHGITLCCDRRIWLRKTVAEMLARVQRSLPRGIHLFIIEGYRSLARQRVIYERFFNLSFTEHPDWPYNIRRREVNRMVAPPDVKCPPGHCTGGAVDLTLITPDGVELDMNSPCHSKLEGCTPTFFPELSPEALANRTLLFNAMEEQGFKNYPLEWWHYSYGDSGWAYRLGLDSCPFGAAPPPAEYEMPTTEPE